MKPLALLSALLLTACGSSAPTISPSPIPVPSPRPAPAPAPVPPATFAGTVVDTVTGAPVSGYTALLSGSRVTVEAPGYLTRDTANGAKVDLIPMRAPFDLGFYRQFVRNTFEAPSALEPLRRQDQSFRVYVRTVDEGGKAIDPKTVSVVLRNITPALVDAFSGGRIALLGVEQGPDAKPDASGWVIVRWPAVRVADRCGQANIGGRSMELFNTPACGCGDGLGTYARVVKHEFGHMMGYWHTDNPSSDLMGNKPDGRNDCDNSPSARERYHAAIAYARAPGNRDLDVDSSSRSVVAPLVVD